MRPNGGRPGEFIDALTIADMAAGLKERLTAVSDLCGQPPAVPC